LIAAEAMKDMLQDAIPTTSKKKKKLKNPSNRNYSQCYWSRQETS
jgi:hypothetical protein